MSLLFISCIKDENSSGSADVEFNKFKWSVFISKFISTNANFNIISCGLR